MNTELAQRQSTAVTNIEVDQGAILNYLGLRKDDPAAQAAVLLCQRYNLDPILKHVVLIEEKAKNKETDQWEKVGRVYITRDGLLHNAHNSNHLDGIEEVTAPHLNEEGTHWVARVAVHRDDMKRPFSYTGRFPAKRMRWTGPKGNREQAEEDHPYGPEMAIKVSECMSLRRAFNISAPSAEERWDRADVAEATVIDHVEQTGGLPPWVTQLVEAHGPVAVREAAGVDFLEHLTDDDEQRVRDALAQASDQADGSDSAPSDEETKPEPGPGRPDWANEVERLHGEQLLLDAINDVRDAAEPRKDPVDSLDEVKWSGIGDVTKKLIDDAVKRRVDARNESAEVHSGAVTERETVAAEQTGTEPQGEAELSSPSPHPCPECGTECVETPESSTKWACPSGHFESYSTDPWKPNGEVEKILRREKYSPKLIELYEFVDGLKAPEARKAIGNVTDRKTLEQMRVVENDRLKPRSTVTDAIDKRLESPDVTGPAESAGPGSADQEPEGAPSAEAEGSAPSAGNPPGSGFWDTIEQHAEAGLVKRNDVLRRAVGLAHAVGIKLDESLTFERVANLPASLLADIIEDLGINSEQTVRNKDASPSTTPAQNGPGGRVEAPVGSPTQESLT